MNSNEFYVSLMVYVLITLVLLLRSIFRHNKHSGEPLPRKIWLKLSLWLIGITCAYTLAVMFDHDVEIQKFTHAIGKTSSFIMLFLKVGALMIGLFLVMASAFILPTLSAFIPFRNKQT